MGLTEQQTGADFTPGSTFQINEAWILYSGSGLFGFNSGLKIGHMPIALGEKQFFDHTKFGDDAIVFFMQPTKALHVALLTFKGHEAFVTDGTDFFSTPGGKPGISGNGADLDAYVALATYALDDKNTVGVNYTFINQPNSTDEFGFSTKAELKFQDLSLHDNGNIAGLGYKAEADMQFGSTLDDDGDKLDLKGYGIMLGLNYNINPLNLRASAAYGSGSKSTDDADIKNFVTFLGADQHYTLVYDYNVVTAAGSTATGISNTTYFNLGADYAATKELTASLDGYYLRASKTDSGISKNVGWEVDARVAYQLAKNLSYVVDAGYLKAGNFYRDTNSGFDKASATVLKHTLTLSF